MEGKWVVASEILPEDGERVLVYVEYPVYGREVYMKKGMTGGKHDDGKWKCDTFIGARVIAWMKFPVAPDGRDYR